MNAIRRLLATAVFWLTWPGLWLLLRSSHRTRLLIVCGQEFLVLQGWLSLGDWGLPGGGLHRGESIVRGVIRETAEETGILFTEKDIKPAFDGIAKSRGIQFTYHALYATVSEKSAIKRRSLEIAAYSWQSLQSPKVILNSEARALVDWWLSQS